MSNAKREIQIIEEAEQDGPGGAAGTRPQSAGPKPSDGAFSVTESPSVAAADARLATPFSTDSLKDIDVESYLAGSSLGVALRQARLKRKLGLEGVSDVLRIRKDHLQAIEQGSYRSLPGPTYAVGFIRAYAAHLGLDAEEAVRRYKEEAGYVRAGPNLSFPTPSPDGRLPGLALLVGVALTAGILYGAWYLFSPGEAPDAPVAQQAETPAAETPAATSGVSQFAPASPAESASEGSAPPVTYPEGAGAAPQPRESAAAPGSAQTTAATSTDEPAAAEAEAAPAPADTEVAAAPEGRVLVSVISDSWVQVRNAAGAVVFTKLLRPGEAYQVPAEEQGLTLLTGNAGAVRVTVDGKTLPPFGSSGEVRRDIPLDADKLLAGAATNE